MFRTLLVFALFAPLPLVAQEWRELAYYVAEIGPEDMRNSSGQRITSLGGVLQQDRANFHRFSIRHRYDQPDPLFANRAMRTNIPNLVRAGGDFRGSLSQMAKRGQSFVVNVFVCGYGQTPSVIYLAGAGEDHSGCF